MLNKLPQHIALLLAGIFILCGCSNSGENTVPTVPSDPVLTSSSHNPSCADETSAYHSLLGEYDILFDLENGGAEITENREAFAHFNIKNFLIPPACSDCLKIDVISIDFTEHILLFDATIKNPFQSLDGYCVRAIIASDDPKHKLINADGYTTLWDYNDPADINPFLGYPVPTALDPWPVFEGGAEHLRTFMLKFGDPPGFVQIKYSIDVSFPDPPDEPALITDITSAGILYPSGGWLAISMSVFDEQVDVNLVTVDTTPITGGLTALDKQCDGIHFTGTINNDLGATPGDYVCLITATSGNSGDLAMYNYITLTVSELPPPPVACFEIVTEPPFHTNVPIFFDASCSSGNKTQYHWNWNDGPPTDTDDPVTNHVFPEPGTYEVILTVEGLGGLSDPVSQLVEVEWGLAWNELTPDNLNWLPFDISIKNDYAFMASGTNGLSVWDISDPNDPELLEKYGPNPGFESKYRIAISDTHAFVITGNRTLEVYVIEPVEATHEISSFFHSSYSLNGIDLSDDYSHVYVTAGAEYGDPARLLIYDSSDPIHTDFINSVVLEDSTPGMVDVQGDYAYVTDFDTLKVIDIGTPEEEEIISSIPMPEEPISGWSDVAVQGDYAYVSMGDEEIYVVDISTPELPEVIKTVPITDETQIFRLRISGDNLFVCGHNYVSIIDITTPEDAYFAGCYYCMDAMFNSVAVKDNYAFATSRNALRVLNIANPSSPNLVSEKFTFHSAAEFDVSGDIACVTDFGTALYTVDISNPETAFIVSLEPDLNSDWDLDMVGNYAYVARDHSIWIYDCGNPASPTFEGQVTAPDIVYSADIYSGYAYMAVDNTGLAIADIDPPGTAGIIKTVTAPFDQQFYVDYEAGYAYAIANNENLYIFDVDPPDEAHLEYDCDVGQFSRAVRVIDGYAYIVQDYNGLVIADVDPPAETSIVKTVDCAIQNNEVEILDGYAYIAGSGSGVKIVDIEPIQDAYLVGGIDTDCWAMHIRVSDDGLIYVTSNHGQLKIFEIL